MQKNETAAIEKSGEEQLNTAAESPEKEISAETKPDKTNPVSADSSEKEPLKTADKISAIRSNLYRMAREEEEEEVVIYRLSGEDENAELQPLEDDALMDELFACGLSD